MDAEFPLQGGDLSTVVRVGNTVRRVPGYWTPAVHALLQHLEAVGFEEAPRTHGYDSQGREIVSYLPGEAATKPLQPYVFTDETLGGVGSLLRRYHQAVTTFVPPPNARWRFWIGMPEEQEIVCHNDLWLPNVVFRKGVPRGLIDWDFAAPAPRLFDVAAAARHWAPLKSDGRTAAAGWPSCPRGPRLRLFSDAYGLNRTERGALLDMVRRSMQSSYASHKAWGEAGIPGFAQLWQRGSGISIQEDIRWLAIHWTELAAALV